MRLIRYCYAHHHHGDDDVPVQPTLSYANMDLLFLEIICSLPNGMTHN